MIRYRCPHCCRADRAHERRAGQVERVQARAVELAHHPGRPARSGSTRRANRSTRPSAATAGPAEPPRSLPATGPRRLQSPCRTVAEPPSRCCPPPSPDRSCPTPPMNRPRPTPVPPVHARAPTGAGRGFARSSGSLAHSRHRARGRTVRPRSAGVATRRRRPASRDGPPARGPAAGGTAPMPVEQAEPVQLQTQADIAVALTAALTQRMKPRAQPRRDLRPSTAVVDAADRHQRWRCFSPRCSRPRVPLRGAGPGVVQIVIGLRVDRPR